LEKQWQERSQALRKEQRFREPKALVGMSMKGRKKEKEEKKR